MISPAVLPQLYKKDFRRPVSPILIECQVHSLFHHSNSPFFNAGLSKMGLKLREKYLLLFIGLVALIGLGTLLIMMKKDKFLVSGSEIPSRIRNIPNRWAAEQQPKDSEFARIQREMLANVTKGDQTEERRAFIKGVSSLSSIIDRLPRLDDEICMV